MLFKAAQDTVDGAISSIISCFYILPVSSSTSEQEVDNVFLFEQRLLHEVK